MPTRDICKNMMLEFVNILKKERDRLKEFVDDCDEDLRRQIPIEHRIVGISSFIDYPIETQREFVSYNEITMLYWYRGKVSILTEIIDTMEEEINLYSEPKIK